MKRHNHTCNRSANAPNAVHPTSAGLAFRKPLSRLGFNSQEMRWGQHCCSEWVQETPHHFFLIGIFLMDRWAVVPSISKYFVLKVPLLRKKPPSPQHTGACVNILYLSSHRAWLRTRSSQQSIAGQRSRPESGTAKGLPGTRSWRHWPGPGSAQARHRDPSLCACRLVHFKSFVVWTRTSQWCLWSSFNFFLSQVIWYFTSNNSRIFRVYETAHISINL